MQWLARVESIAGHGQPRQWLCVPCAQRGAAQTATRAMVDDTAQGALRSAVAPSAQRQPGIAHSRVCPAAGEVRRFSFEPPRLSDLFMEAVAAPQPPASAAEDDR